VGQVFNVVVAGKAYTAVSINGYAIVIPNSCCKKINIKSKLK
jgi:hypothetical protein